MTDKTITFITALDPTSTAGGGGVATKEILKAFCDRDDLSVSLICPRPKKNLPSAIEKSLQSVHYLPPRTNAGTLRYHGKEEVVLCWKLVQNIRSQNPDIIISRLAPSLIVPPVIASIYDIPFVILARGRLQVRDGSNQYNWASLAKTSYKINFSLGDVAISSTADIKSEIRHFSPDIPIEIFTNAVNPEIFEPKPIKMARETLGYDLKPDEFVVGFVGSLANRHRLTELFEGFAEAVGSEPDTKLLIVGGKEGSDKMRRLRELAGNVGIENRVLFTGTVPHNSVPVHISACDVLYGVSDPNFPTAPLKVFEYLACGRPVITTQQRELSFVSEYELGYILNEMTSGAVAQGIQRYYRSERGEALSQGRRGRKFVLNNHTWDKLPEIVFDCIEESVS